MSEFGGYTARSLELLKSNDIQIGDTVKITSDMTYDGVIMPKYGSDGIIVLKLKSGYNVGIKADKISEIKLVKHAEIESHSIDVKSNAKDLPKILLLSTGGTIASKIDYRTGAVTPAVTADEINASVPELSEIAKIVPRVLFSEHSENLQPEHWKKIAKELDSAINSDYTGIILAHGTDTMQYTAAYLSFALSGFPIPVAIVGSQRSPDRPSSDAALNLTAAAKFLTLTKHNGIYVVMHHDRSDGAVACHIATRVRKNHTSKRGAFETIGAEPVFLILEDKIKDNASGEFFKKNRYNPRISLDSSVALIKYHPGYDPKILDNIVKSGCRGIIFEGTGLGHVGRTMYDSIKNAADSGVFLGMTSQCIDGQIRMTVYESGRDLLNMGIIPLKNMIPETALVKAMWALGQTDNAEQAGKIMLENIASEFSD